MRLAAARAVSDIGKPTQVGDGVVRGYVIAWCGRGRLVARGGARPSGLVVDPCVRTTDEIRMKLGDLEVVGSVLAVEAAGRRDADRRAGLAGERVLPRRELGGRNPAATFDVKGVVGRDADGVDARRGLQRHLVEDSMRGDDCTKDGSVGEGPRNFVA